jgi:hypothetical protein
MEKNIEIPQKLKTELSYYLAVSLLGISPEEIKSVFKRDT